MNDGHTIHYLLFKSTNPDRIIGDSNLKYKIRRTTLAKFGNNVKDLLDKFSSNYLIIIYKGDCDEDYVRHIFRDIL